MDEARGRQAIRAVGGGGGARERGIDGDEAPRGRNRAPIGEGATCKEAPGATISVEGRLYYPPRETTPMVSGAGRRRDGFRRAGPHAVCSWACGRSSAGVAPLVGTLARTR